MRSRAILVGTMALPAAGFAAGCVAPLFEPLEEPLIFRPRPLDEAEARALSHASRIEQVRVPTTDGVTLHGWLMRARYNPSLMAPLVSAPALFLLAEKDDVTPVKNGLALARRWGGKVRTVMLAGRRPPRLERREGVWGPGGG